MSAAALREKLRLLEAGCDDPILDRPPAHTAPPADTSPAKPPASLKSPPTHHHSDAVWNEWEAMVLAQEEAANAVAPHVAQCNASLSRRISDIDTRRAELASTFRAIGANTDILDALATPVISDRHNTAHGSSGTPADRVIWDLPCDADTPLVKRHRHALELRLQRAEAVLREHKAVSLRTLSCARNEQRLKTFEDAITARDSALQVEAEEAGWVRTRRSEDGTLQDAYATAREAVIRANNAVLLAEGKVRHAAIQSRLERPQVGQPVTGIPSEEFDEVLPLLEAVLEEHPVPADPEPCCTLRGMTIHDVARLHRHRAERLTELRGLLEKRVAALQGLVDQAEGIRSDLHSREASLQVTQLRLLKNRGKARTQEKIARRQVQDADAEVQSSCGSSGAGAVESQTPEGCDEEAAADGGGDAGSGSGCGGSVPSEHGSPSPVGVEEVGGQALQPDADACAADAGEGQEADGVEGSVPHEGQGGEAEGLE